MTNGNVVFNSEAAPGQHGPDTSMRRRLNTLGFCDQPKGLEKVDRFFAALDLSHPDRAFACAADALTKATLIFALIEDETYHKLSYAKLKEYAEGSQGTAHNILSWVLKHFLAIVELTSTTEQSDGISRRDLLLVRKLCRGLDYAHHHFEQIATDRTATALHDNDILLYVWSCGSSLDGDTRRGLLQLATFLQNGCFSQD